MGNTIFLVATLSWLVLCSAVPSCIAEDVTKTSREMPSGQSANENIFLLGGDESRVQTQTAAGGAPRVALALGGGGTRGGAHVGVLRVLQNAGIPIDCIAGTSIGAIVGGLYSAGVSLDRLEELLRDNAIMKAFIDVPVKVDVAVQPIRLLPRLVGYKNFDGLYQGSKFRKFLTKEVPDGRENIEQSKIPFCAVALNLLDGHPYALTKGDLVHAMQASSAVPELRSPVLIGDQLFVDGGVVANVPVTQARDALHGTFVIAVDVDERLKKASVEQFKKLGSVGARLVTLELARVDSPQVQKANFVIHPNVDGIGLISTKASDAVSAMEAGERAANDALPELIKALQANGIKLKPLNGAVSDVSPATGQAN